MANNVKSIKFWRNITDEYPILEVSINGISMLHMGGISHEIILCGNQCGSVNNFDDLLIILDLSKISNKQKKQILEKDFSICEIDLVYDDSDIIVYQLPSMEIKSNSSNFIKVFETENTLEIKVNRKKEV